MEAEPDTTNIYYLDEYRKAHWTTELQRARETGCVVMFGTIHDYLAEVIPFPIQEVVSDDIA